MAMHGWVSLFKTFSLMKIAVVEKKLQFSHHLRLGLHLSVKSIVYFKQKFCTPSAVPLPPAFKLSVC